MPHSLFYRESTWIIRRFITCPTRSYLLTQGVRLFDSITRHFSISHSTSAFATTLLQPAWWPQHLTPSTSTAWPLNHKTSKMNLCFPPGRPICTNPMAIYYNSFTSHLKWGAREWQGLCQVSQSSLQNTWLADQEGKAPRVQTPIQVIRGLVTGKLLGIYVLKCHTKVDSWSASPANRAGRTALQHPISCPKHPDSTWHMNCTENWNSLANLRTKGRRDKVFC